MDQGHYLTSSGSKIPMPKKKISPALSVCTVDVTNIVPTEQPPAIAVVKPSSSTAAKPTAASSNRMNTKAVARSIPNLNKASSTVPSSISRSKTFAARNAGGRTIAAAATSAATLKRAAPVAEVPESTAPKQAKQAPKTGFPYKSKNWELKARLAECEEWVVEWRTKCLESEEASQECELERDSLRAEVATHKQTTASLQANIQMLQNNNNTLQAQINEKTNEFNKLCSDSKEFIDKIKYLEDSFNEKDNQVKTLQDEVSKLSQELSNKDNTISQLRITNDDLEYKVKRQKNQLDDVETLLSKSKAEASELHAKLREVEYQFSQMKDNYERAEREVMFKCSTVKELTDEINKAQSRINKLNTEITVSDNKVTDLTDKLETAEKTIVEIKQELGLSKDRSELLTEKLCSSERHRRVLHNTVQDLKGNIRVFCRVRPPILSEKENASPVCSITFPDEGSLEISKADPFSNGNASVSNITRPKFSKHEFVFDRVFHPSATQEDVFNELSQLVQSALDGYNVCVFAYGQTGSGKTYTMEGISNSDSRGMIPRTVEHIFTSLTDLELIGWEYKIEVCFIEIYNEILRDLLRNDKEGSSLKIMQVDTKTNDVIIPGLTVMEVKTFDELDRLYVLAHQNRAVAATSCNDRSSRSHSVTKIKVTGIHKEKNQTCYGSLNLVDLAGSERLNEPMSDPRFREMKNINKSLSELGNVILNLLQKQEHIPYRNSKLTHLLQPALGGSSKTLMLVNVSPLENCLQETLCSLRFAQKVNQVKVGASKKRIAYESSGQK